MTLVKLDSGDYISTEAVDVIKEFSSQYEADLYCERLNYERLERLGLIEHLDTPAIEFE